MSWYNHYLYSYHKVYKLYRVIFEVLVDRWWSNCSIIEIPLVRINVYYHTLYSMLMNNVLWTERFMACQNQVEIVTIQRHWRNGHQVWLQKEKGNLFINTDQLKTCYSFLYRISFLIFSKAVIGCMVYFLLSTHELLEGSP